MAINGLTYYVSVDNPNYKLLDSNSVATTSITTSAISVALASETFYYINNPAVSLASGYAATSTSISNRLSNISNIVYNNNYIEVRNSSITVGVSIPVEYTDSGSTIYSSGVYWQSTTSIDPSFRLTWDSLASLYIAESKSDIYTHTRCTRYGDAYRITVRDDATISTILAFSSYTSENSTTGTDSLNNSFSISTKIIYTHDSGFVFSSSTSQGGITSFHSTYHEGTSQYLTIPCTFSVNDNGSYTTSTKLYQSWYSRVLILDPRVTQSTSWVSITSNVQTSITNSNIGLVVDEDGNVGYGYIYGYGPDLWLIAGNYGNLRPAVITSFSKELDVTTVDTSWYGTFTTQSITSNATYTTDKYVEWNNYGVGGTFSQGTYSWHTSSLTSYSESSRTSYVRMTISSCNASISATIPVANIITNVISDNSFPRQSETKSSMSRSSPYYNGTFSTSATEVASESSMSEVNNTRTNYSTSRTFEYSVDAYNQYVSVTNTYTTSASKLYTSYSTTFYEVTETSSCDVTSYSDRYGYSYYTTFYGELANETLYTTSWVNSAVAYTVSFIDYDQLTIYSINETYKTFGNVANSTTISESSIIDSTVYTTSSSSKVSESTFNWVETYKTVNIPEEEYTTYATTYRTVTTYSTYVGIDEYYYGDMDYVLVTRLGSRTRYEEISYSSSSLIVINTSAYGGTTYRLSDLISSSSTIIPGNNNMTGSYVYDYDVKSMFSLDTYIATLSNYTTRLRTSYTSSYSTRRDYDDYYVTKSTSLAAKSTGDRFIDRVEISRTSTVSYEVTNTVAIYNGSTVATLNSAASSYNMQSGQDVSTVSRTFISSTADLDITTEIASSATETTAKGSFIYSSRELVSSMTEQQNDTLIFASTFNTYSFYNSSYTTSTLNIVASTLSATTYEDWYNPVSWTSTALSIATSTDQAETVNITSGVVSVTQSVNYTPVYSTVDGVYVTA